MKTEVAPGATGNTPSPKRRRLDPNGHADGEGGGVAHIEPIGVGGASAEKTAAAEPRPGLSDEQRARIESNRLLAQQRKQQQLLLQQQQGAVATVVEPAAAPGVTAEQRARIEQNRALAAERRRLQQLQTQSALGAQGPDARAGATTPLGPVAVEAVEREGTTAEGGLQGHGIENCSSSAPSSSEDSEDSSDSSAESSSDESTGSEGSVASDRPSAAGSDCGAESLGASSDSGDGSANADDAQSASESGELAKSRAVCTQPQVRLSGAQRQRILANQQLALKKQNFRGLRKRAAAPGAPGSQDKPAPAAKDVQTLPKKERSAKQKLVAEVLCRWWYVLPPWPPVDFDAQAALWSRGCRGVPVESFEYEPEFDEHGRKKVFAVTGFPGVFRDEQGVLMDVRPEEGRPSYDQLSKRPMAELHRLLIQAYDAQLAELEAQPLTGCMAEEQLHQLQKQAKQARASMFGRLFDPKAAAAASRAATPATTAGKEEPAPRTGGAGAPAGEVEEMARRLQGIVDVARCAGKDPTEVVESFGRRIASAGFALDIFRAAAKTVLG